MLNFRAPNFNRRDQIPTPVQPSSQAPRSKNEVMDLKVAEVLANRLHEKRFVNNPYSQADVDADLDYVMRRKKEHKKGETFQSFEQKRVADLFEALVLWNSEQAEWLGSRATTIKTSEYDDYKNGVDMVVEFREERSASYLGLAADVTFSSDGAVIAKKFASLREQIKRGTLAQVKYFHSDHTHFDGQLSKLPEVVIGVSKGMVLDLARLWTDGKHQDLANHKVGIMFLRQIEAQLRVFAEYAESMHQTEVARIYADRLALIQEILAEKAELVNKLGITNETDPVHLEIMKFVENWSRY
ncbi:MAG: hypothetical protein AAB815_03180 [Patescibacteria group bacterium]